MNIRNLIQLRTAVAVACALGLAAACGSSDGDRAKQNSPKPNIPSIARDDRAATSSVNVAARDAGAGEAQPVATPVDPPPPTTYRDMMARGKKLARAGEHDDAVDMFEMAAKASKLASSPRIELARTYLAQKQLGKARTYAERGVKLAPRSSYAWNTLGRVELAEGKRDAAITSFERSTEEDQDNSYAWNNLGYTLMLDEQWDEAVIALERATSGNHPKSYMWNNLGMAYEHEDRLDEARAAYRQAASAGSARAQASLRRLRGVKSVNTDTTEPAIETQGRPDAGAVDPADKASDNDGDDEAEEGVLEDDLGC